MLTPEQIGEIWDLGTHCKGGIKLPLTQQLMDAKAALLADRAELAGELREVVKAGCTKEPAMAGRIYAIVARLEGK
jgi:hypothetical protein